MQTESEKQIVDEAFWAFINATNTTTAGGGIDGYQHMLGHVAWMMACDHGHGAVARVFEAIAREYEAR